MSNRTSTAVVVYARACGSAEPGRALHPSSIEVGSTLDIALSRGCYDFEAMSADGRVMGRQHGVQLRRPMDWSIAR